MAGSHLPQAESETRPKGMVTPTGGTKIYKIGVGAYITYPVLVNRETVGLLTSGWQRTARGLIPYVVRERGREPGRRVKPVAAAYPLTGQSARPHPVRPRPRTADHLPHLVRVSGPSCPIEGVVMVMTRDRQGVTGRPVIGDGKCGQTAVRILAPRRCRVTRSQIRYDGTAGRERYQAIARRPRGWPKKRPTFFSCMVLIV